MKSSDSANPKDTSPKLGTFTGVFVPNTLTILGVILFMRAGWVVGQAGVMLSLVILVIANSITLMTAFSLSAIATNSRVGGGGAYFMISRSLGLEIGGSIGVPLFFAQAVSVAFYAIGFTESLFIFYPDLNVRLVAGIVVLVLFLITWKSSDFAFKTQNFIFIILILSLLSFFGGFKPDSQWADNLHARYIEGQNFWLVFAIFFPAVTGVMAGASMSGDLKNPGKSIPLGTLLSVILTFLVYAWQIIWLGKNIPRVELLENPLVMRTIAVVPPLIYVGLWAATLSSALASLLAAPRTLQALGGDGVLPRWLSRVDGERKEPRVALVISFILALACVLIGELNLIAPIISMFFLATYGMVNAVAFLERIVYNPSYRPTFNPHWSISLLGAIGCFWVMFLLNAAATVLSIILVLGLYFYLSQKKYRTAWGDMRSGFWFSLTRFALLKFEDSQKHLRNWRPVILVLSGNPKTRHKLVQFANWMECKRGFLFLAQILTGAYEKLSDRAKAARRSINDYIEEHRLAGTAQVVISETFEQGAVSLLQLSGVGPIIPNTVMLGWNENMGNRERYSQTLQSILLMEKNVVLFIEEEESAVGQLNPCIDVWWRSKQNGILMVTLAHLMRQNAHWKNHKLRVNMLVENVAAVESARNNLETILEEIRIRATVYIQSISKPVHEIILETSCYSEVCFLGINLEPSLHDAHPLQSVDRIAESFHGNVLVTKTWEDLHATWD